MKNGTYFENIINGLELLLVYTDSTGNISDGILDPNEVGTLAKRIIKLLKYSIKNSLPITMGLDLSGGITTISISGNDDSTCEISMYYGYRSGIQMPRILITDDVSNDITFGISYLDMEKLFDKIISGLGEDDRAYLLLNNVDLEQYKKETLSSMLFDADYFE